MQRTKIAETLPERQAAAVTDRLLNVREMAHRLGVSARQVWKLCASGRLPPPLRLARSVRWRAADITRFIEVGCNMQAFEAQRASEQAEIARQRRAAVGAAGRRA